MKDPHEAPISRAQLHGGRQRLLNRGGRRNPDVLLVEAGDRCMVVKDFAPRGPLVRWLLGPWLTSREIRAYCRLEGHPAVPRLLGRIDALAFAVEYRPGRPMQRALAPELPPEFLDELERAIRGLHERGVVHLDLSHRSNVLLDGAGGPVLIDFASAFCFRPGGFGWRRVMPLLARLDVRAIRKWRRKLQPSAAAGRLSGSGRGASRPT